MKNLDDVLRREFDHLVIDCCPRDGDNTPPVDDSHVEFCYSDKHYFKPRRKMYTFYMNIGICRSLVDSGSFKVVCPKCKLIYRITEERVKKEFLDYIEEKDKPLF